MGRPHTTIGAERFHFRVRNGIGWFPLAIAARKSVGTMLAFTGRYRDSECQHCTELNNNLDKFLMSRVSFSVALHVASHTKMLWCYMAKPHGQLVLVSFIHY